ETADGGLQYSDWNAILDSQQLMYVMRAVGGGMFVLGWLMMAWNLIATALSGRPATVATEVTVLRHERPAGEPSTARLVFSTPVIMVLIGLGAATLFAMPNVGLAVLGFVLLTGVVMFAGGMLS